MIASVRGSVLHVGLDRAVVEVGGVGMLVHTTPGTASALRHGQEAVLHDAGRARGLPDPLRLRRGRRARHVRAGADRVRVGPRLALAMPSVMARPIRAAITGSDIAALTKVPGIGKKGAERMVLEPATRSACRRGPPAPRPADLDRGARAGHEALVGFGWSAKQADDAVERVGFHGRGEPQRSDSAARPCASWAGRRLMASDGFASEIYEDSSSMPPPGSSTRAVTPTSALSRRRCAPAAERVPRADEGLRPARARARGSQAARRHPRPCPAVRPARAGQDHPGDDRRGRAREAHPGDERAGHPARRDLAAVLPR